MNEKAFTTLLLLAGIAAEQAKPAPRPTSKPETAHFRYVKEYVRELSEDEDLKLTGEKELSEAQTVNARFSAGIYFSKSTQLELRSQIAMLKAMRLDDPFDTLIVSHFRET